MHNNGNGRSQTGYRRVLPSTSINEAVLDKMRRVYGSSIYRTRFRYCIASDKMMVCVTGFKDTFTDLKRRFGSMSVEQYVAVLFDGHAGCEHLLKNEEDKGYWTAAGLWYQGAASAELHEALFPTTKSNLSAAIAGPGKQFLPADASSPRSNTESDVLKRRKTGNDSYEESRAKNSTAGLLSGPGLLLAGNTATTLLNTATPPATTTTTMLAPPAPAPRMLIPPVARTSSSSASTAAPKATPIAATRQLVPTPTLPAPVPAVSSMATVLPMLNSPVELPPKYTAVAEMLVDMPPWTETIGTSMDPSNKAQLDAHRRTLRMFVHPRSDSNTRSIWTKEDAPPQELFLSTRYELGWAAHKELDQRQPSVILTCNSQLSPNSRLVPTTDPKRVLYSATYCGQYFIFTRKESELVPAWSPSSPVHTVLYGFNFADGWLTSQASKSIAKLRELTIIIEPVNLLFEVHETNKKNRRVPEPPVDSMSIFCTLDRTPTVIYMYPWANELLHFLIKDKTINLIFRSTVLTAPQLQHAFQAAITGGYDMFIGFTDVSYPPITCKAHNRPIPADISDVLDFAQASKPASLDAKYDYASLDKTIVILDRSAAAWSLRSQRFVLQVNIPVTNRSLTSKGRAREDKGQRVKRLIDNFQQCKRKYGFVGGGVPASWKALYRSTHALLASDMLSKYDDLWRSCIDTVRDDRIVEYNRKLVEYYFNKTDG